MAAGASPWTVEPEAFEQYCNIFEEVVGSSEAFFGPDSARELLGRSQLPHEELAHIWLLSDVDDDGVLSLKEFAIAMHLVSRRKQGLELPRTLPPELAATLQHDSRRAPPLPTGYVQHEAQQDQTSWVVAPEQLEKYRHIFEAVVGNSNTALLGPDAAREIMDRSQLPHRELAKIWQLSDVNGDGQLSFGEFACAMSLVNERRQGRELPTELPAALLQPLLC